MVILHMKSFSLPLLLLCAALAATACGVKKPPTPVYSMTPFAETAATPTPTPTATPVPSPTPKKKPGRR